MKKEMPTLAATKVGKLQKNMQEHYTWEMGKMPEEILKTGFDMDLFKPGTGVRVHGYKNTVCGFVADATQEKVLVKSFVDDNILLSCWITIEDVLEELVIIEVVGRN